MSEFDNEDISFQTIDNESLESIIEEYQHDTVEVTGNISIVDGTVGSPAIQFTDTPTLGLYKDTSTSIGVTGDMTLPLEGTLDNGSGEGMDFSDSASSITLRAGGNNVFNSDAVASEILHNGTPILTVSTSQATLAVPLIVPDGLEIAPSVRFAGDLTTGFYLGLADRLTVVHDGQSCATFDPSFTVVDGRLGVATSTAAQPGLYFNGDQDTGVDALFADSLSLIAGGASIAQCTSSGLGVLVGGLLLPTTGGAQSALDYYEEYGDSLAMYQSATTNDFYTAPATLAVTVTRVGRQITVSWPDSTGTTAGAIRAQVNLPSRFAVSGDFQVQSYQATDDGTAAFSAVTINSSSNLRFGFQEFGGSFSSGVVVTLKAGSITYCCP
jgi:hypothetical protein